MAESKIQDENKLVVNDLEDKRSLDLQLKEKGFLLVKEQNPVQKYGKDFVESLRRAKDHERRVLYKRESKDVDFLSIQRRFGEISARNKEIEDQINLEILGIQNQPLKKLAYSLTQLYRTKIKGQEQQRAEDIISAQLDVIRNVVNDLGIGSGCIDAKISNLENYYDNVLLNLISRYHDREKTLEEINETVDLLSGTEEATKNSIDFAERLAYNRAHRKLRKNLQSDMLKLKITDKAMLLMKNELPLLDNLSDVCEAYSGALKETHQEATFMARHLENVMELYFDMMRSQKINYSLEGEVKKLFTYTNNMNNALKDGAALIVEKANSSDLFTQEYQTNSLTLETVLNDIESSNSRSFREVESRISGYLNA